jgi:hypothetical protein
MIGKDKLITRRRKMKKSEFMMLCGRHCVDVSLALGHDEIVNALKNREDDVVVDLMDELF